MQPGAALIKEPSCSTGNDILDSIYTEQEGNWSTSLMLNKLQKLWHIIGKGTRRYGPEPQQTASHLWMAAFMAINGSQDHCIRWSIYQGACHANHDIVSRRKCGILARYKWSVFQWVQSVIWLGMVWWLTGPLFSPVLKRPLGNQECCAVLERWGPRIQHDLWCVTCGPVGTSCP